MNKKKREDKQKFHFSYEFVGICLESMRKQIAAMKVIWRQNGLHNVYVITDVWWEQNSIKCERSDNVFPCQFAIRTNNPQPHSQAIEKFCDLRANKTK